MKCPGCGYDVDDDAVFCPQCRYQFRRAADEPGSGGDTGGPEAPADTMIDLPDRGVIDDESIFEDEQKGFTEKELRHLEVQLLQPAVLIVLLIALVTYTVIAEIPFIPLKVAGLDFGVTGVICLFAGLAAGIIFFVLARRTLAKFRYR